MNKGIARKFIEFAMGNGIALILGFVSTPLISRLVMPEEMGKFSNFNTVTGLLCLILLFGLDQSFVRYYYEEEPESRKKLLYECIKIPIILCLVASILMLTLYRPISRYIIGDESLNIIIILILHTFFTILSIFALLVIRMQQHGKLYSLMQIITKSTYIIFTLMIFKVYGNDHKTVILAIVLSNVVILILSIYFERDQWDFWKNNITIKSEKKSLIRYGLPLVFSASITWIFQTIDRIFLNVYCTKADVGIYAMAFSIIALLNAVQGAFTTFWTPVANESYNKNPNDTSLFEKINKYVVVFMSFIAIGLIGGKDIIIYILGPEYKEAVFIIPFLVFMPIMYTISEVTVIGISFKKKTKYHIVVAVISAVVNITGNFILVPILGARGAALSTGLSYIVFFAIRTYISQKLYKVNYEVKKFSILILGMIILATYSTLYKLNLIIVLLTLLNLGGLYFLYRTTVNEIALNLINIVKKNVKRE